VEVDFFIFDPYFCDGYFWHNIFFLNLIQVSMMQDYDILITHPRSNRDEDLNIELIASLDENSITSLAK
jgi:hypothetical protein